MAKLVKHKLNISGMHCTSCALNIDWDLEDLSGVASVKTSYGSQECIVEFDEDQVNLGDIIKSIKKTGYAAQVKGN